MKPQDILKNAREKAGYTQEVIAKEIGISGRMYQRYESGSFPKFKGEAIEKLDKLLGTSLTAILYDNKGRVAENVPSDLVLTGARVTLQDYIDLLKKNYEKADQEKSMLLSALERISEMYSMLNYVKANSDATIIKLDAIEDQVRSEHAVEMDSLDRIEKNPVGTNAIKAGNLEIDRKTKRNETGKRADAGRSDK